MIHNDTMIAEEQRTKLHCVPLCIASITFLFQRRRHNKEKTSTSNETGCSQNLREKKERESSGVERGVQVVNDSTTLSSATT